jgi:hypothetical protein
MSLEPLQTLDIIEVLENFLERKRPPLEIRSKLDFGYRIEGQSIFIFEIRPFWDNPSKIQHLDTVKTTFVKTKNEWAVYWMRGNLKWDKYKPCPAVKNIKALIKLIEEDEYACFWG